MACDINAYEATEKAEKAGHEYMYRERHGGRYAV